MNLAESPPRGATTKFTYASGSRPLEGYTIKRGVGRGGFGEVYYATSDAGKEVALKLVRRNLDIELRGAQPGHITVLVAAAAASQWLLLRGWRK